MAVRNKVPFTGSIWFLHSPDISLALSALSALYGLGVAVSGTKKAPLLRLAGALQTTYLFLHTMRA